VSGSAICDAMMRRRAHRAHVIDLVSPAARAMGPGARGDHAVPAPATDLVDAAVHDFDPMLRAALGGPEPSGRVLVASSWGHPDAALAGGRKLSRLATWAWPGW
jgi:4-hydroxy-4-methyl-2-oxoglutarate aldolase